MGWINRSRRQLFSEYAFLGPLYPGPAARPDASAPRRCSGFYQRKPDGRAHHPLGGEQVAVVFDVSKQTIYNWIEQGRFPNKEEVGEGHGTVILIPDSNVEVVKKEEADKLIAKLNHLGLQSASA